MRLSRKAYKIFVLVFLSLMVYGCAAAPVTQVPREENNLKDICSRYGLKWHWDSVSQIVTITRGTTTAKAMVGSSLVVVDDDTITLTAPLRRYRGIVIVPADFKKKIVDRLLKKPDFAVSKFRKIMIDPGHGGKDPGAIGKTTGLKEKTVVLDIAMYLKRNLEEKGLEVMMTRDRDEFVSLEDRAQLANKSDVDLFFSIHANSTRARSISGMEIYYLRDSDNITQNDMLRNHEEAFNRFSMQKENRVLRSIILDMLSVYKQAESKKLARAIAQDASDAVNSKNRGIKSSGFFVLKNTLIPAILIEVGFLSNRNEEKLLETTSYRQQIADGLAESIIEYVGN